MPIVLAQMIVLAPKYGASSRAAEISAPRLAIPPQKTSTSRKRSETGPRTPGES